MVEAQYELSKRTTLRVKRGIVTAEEAEAILQQAADDVARHVHVLGLDDYAAGLAEARWRLPRDPNDVPVLALALTLNWGIWTADYDFFGCGAAVWSTEVLLEYVTRATPAA